MGEQLKLIQSLRDEISELDKKIRDIKSDYIDKKTDYDFELQSTEDLKYDLEVLKLSFRNAKDGKILKVIFPTLIIVMIIVYILLKYLKNLPIHNIVMCEMVVMMSSLIPLCLSVTIFDKIIEKHLIKKYPSLKELHDKIQSLPKIIDLKEKNIIKLKREMDNLEHTFEIIKIKYRTKKQELDKLIDDYFSNVEENNVTYNQGNIPVTEENKGKRRIRVPNNNQNLDN